MNKATAFAPAHISGFFQPVTESDNISKVGSRGAGVSIDHGAHALVELKKSSKQQIAIRVNEKKGIFPVTLEALKRIVGEDKVDLNVNISLDLPTSHGFGMSAASALSSSLAVAHLLEKEREEAIEAAHYAEILHHTGLGDVISSALGGFEIRETPGIFPYAKIHKISEKRSILLAILSGEMSTKSVLTDINRMNHISKIGKYCTDQVMNSPTIDSIMNYSYYFTIESKLASKKMVQLLNNIKNYYHASMCMLGHSIFIIGTREEITRDINMSCSLIETMVDNKGARLVDSTK